MTAERLAKLSLVDEVVPEPLGGAHREPAAMAERLRATLARTMDELCQRSPGELVAARAKRLQSFGVFRDA